MIFFACFIISGTADEYWKTICICQKGKCQGSDKCKDQPVLDPTSKTFIIDFDTVRNNIKNVDFYIDQNYYNPLDINLDIRNIIGLTLNISSYGAISEMKLTYISGQDYAGNIFNFLDKNVRPIFIPFDDKKADAVLRIGTINMQASKPDFYLKDGRKIHIKYNSIIIPTSSFVNISGLEKIGTGDIGFIIDGSDVLEITIAKTNSNFKLNSQEYAMSFRHEDKLIVKGKYTGNKMSDDALKIKITDDLTYLELPLISIGYISKVEIIGKLWAPSASIAIGEIYNIGDLTIPQGDFPFSIYSQKVKLMITGDTTIHGNIDNEYYDTKYSELEITTELTSKVNVTFKGYVDSTITIQSPYLNLYIDNYTLTDNSISTFPIGFCFNENISSFVYLKYASFFGKPTISASDIQSYPTITTAYTDEYLDGRPIKQGFVFIDLPENSLSATTYNVKVVLGSPSIMNGIPGFVSKGNCMSITKEQSGRAKLKAFKSMTAYSLPAYLCITSDSAKCSNSNVFPYSNIETTDISDISQYVKLGFKEIYISTTVTNRDISINLNNLIGDKLIVTLEGKSSRSYSPYKITYTNNKISQFTFRYAKLEDNFAFNMQVVNIAHVTFNKAKTFSFGSSTKINIDFKSLDSLFKLDNIPTLNDVLLKYADSIYSYYSYDETIKIDNNLYEICLNELAAGEYFPTSMCASNINPQYFNKLTYFSQFKLVFTVNSMESSIKPINIIIDPSSDSKMYTLELKGNGWDTKLKNNFTIDNGNNVIAVKIESPGQVDNISFIGKVSVLFNVNYQNSQKYCIYTDESGGCYQSSPLKTIQVKQADFYAFSSNINNISVELNFDYFADSYRLKSSILDRKKVVLKTSTGSELSKVEFESDIQSLSPIYSLTQFDKIQTVLSKDEPATYSFGQLVIKEWTVDANWKKNAKLVVSQLKCTYGHIVQCKNITITDQLILSGDVPTEGDDVYIDFQQDGDAYDLVADVKGDFTITVGKGFIKIGKITYKITHSDNYDVCFKITDHSKIIIESEVNDKSDFVKFLIDCDSYTVDVEFKGTYPIPSDNEESYISMNGTGKVNITTSSSLPLSIKDFKDVEFNLMNEGITTISGPLGFYNDYFTDNKDGNMRFYNHQSKLITLTIPNGIHFQGLSFRDSNFTGIMSPNIKLIISKFPATKIEGKINLINAIGREGSSQITFLEPLPEKIKINKIYVLTEVYGKIEDESNFPYISTPEVIVRARSQDLSSLQLTLEYVVNNKENLTHGFSPNVNCLEINQAIDGQYNNVILQARVKPSEIPFIIDFVSSNDKTDGELVINDDNINVLNDLNELLPKVFVGIIMRLYRDMEENHILNLDNIVKNRPSLSVEVKSDDKQYECYMTLPTSNILTLACMNVQIGFKNFASGVFKAKKVSFVDCEFINANNFKFSNEISEVDSDVDSFNELVSGGSFSGYTGKIFVNSANVILFTKDGWEFREDRTKRTVPIPSSMFQTIQFSTNHLCYLLIEDEALDSIHSFKFDSYPNDQGTVLFELSRHWGKVKNLNDFKINVNGATRVNLNTASYPIPDLFDISKSNIGYTLETDASGEFDTITLENNKLYKDEDLNLDFTFLPDEFHYINGDKVIFEGNSNINFVKGVGTLRLDESVFKQKSNTTLTRLETLKLMTVERTAEVTGTFKFSLSSTLQLHWTLTETPMLNHKSFEKGSPQWLELIYDDSTADRDLYNSKMLKKSGLILMKGNFECFAMKNNVKFSGSYLPFGPENTHLNVACDSSAEGQVLLLQGLKEITDEDESKGGGGDGKGPKVSSGGIAGIVIACAVIVGAAAAGIVYYFQRIKIDNLKNEIPVENSPAYKANSYETKETTQSETDNVDDNYDKDPFDDV